MRPWVLALPPVGVALARAGPRAIAGVVRAFVIAVFGELRRAFRSEGSGATAAGLRCAAVSCVVPVDAALEPGLQIHALFADGVFAEGFRAGRGPPDLAAVAARVRADLRRAWKEQRWGPLRRPDAPPSGAVRRVQAPPDSRGSPWSQWSQWSVAAEGSIVVAAGSRIEADERGRVFEWAQAVGRPVLDPARVHVRRDGWLVFTPSPVLERASARVARRLPLARVELSPSAVMARLGSRRCPGRRIRFHGLLAAGRDARDQVLPTQLGLGDEPARVIKPSPAGRRYVLRPAPLQRVSPCDQASAARSASTRRASDSEGAK